MELLQGCRNKKELVELRKTMRQQSVEQVPITSAIADRAVDLLTLYSSASGLRLADALIAATAMEYGHVLLTANMKHFRSIEGLQVEKFEMRMHPLSPSVHETRAEYGLGTTYPVVAVDG